MAVTNRLKEILDERGIKQTWLAEKCNVDRSTISSIIAHRYSTNLEVAMKIAQVLDMKIEDIFKIDESQK
jgi:DNA-binding XRE family transcriptional regulator